MTSGNIFDIQRFCVHDGPGIRTTVFLKGCTLRCLWCHNPEGVSAAPQFSFLPERCIGCGYCARVCPNEAHRMDPEKGHFLDRERCTVCGACVKECYAGALELVGRQATVAEVMETVLRDRTFYETSGGGMTLSGGEPLMQINFTEALLRAAAEAGVHRAVETCGYVGWDRFERVLPLVDLFLYDVKETDPVKHVEFTGAPNAGILANLRTLHDRGAAVLVRLPIVPGLNDRPDHFESLAALARELPGLRGFEVMPYHRLGSGKRERFGLEPDGLAHVETPDPETVSGWVQALRGLRC